jgi:hypothetical protein
MQVFMGSHAESCGQEFDQVMEHIQKEEVV